MMRSSEICDCECCDSTVVGCGYSGELTCENREMERQRDTEGKQSRSSGPHHSLLPDMCELSNPGSLHRKSVAGLSGHAPRRTVHPPGVLHGSPEEQADK